MSGSYLKIAWRNLMKHKLSNALNIIGLSLGLVCCLFIMFYLKKELSYDKGFPKSDRIYRITHEELGDNGRHFAATSPVTGGEIRENIPEIEKTARFHYTSSRVLRYQSPEGAMKEFEEKNGYYADPEVVDVFDLKFIKGNPRLALNDVNSIVLTETMARKYFGDKEPLGKTINFYGDYDNRILRVTGVLKDRSFSTHLQFDFLISMATRYAFNQEVLNNKNWSGFYTYVLLHDSQSKERVESKLTEFTTRFYAAPDITRKQILASHSFHLQPITGIHLGSNLEKEMGPNGSITYIYIYATVALFILLVSGINFINMSTAHAFERMKEVGIRKVMGAAKQTLIWQFLCESFLLILIATLLAMILMRLAWPFYYSLTGISLNFKQIFSLSNIGLSVAVLIIVGLFSGLYPAWFAAGFNPINALKGKRLPDSSVKFIRSGLTILQFATSVFLIASTLIIYQQMQLIKNKKLGFDKDQVIAIKLYGDLKKSTTTNNNALKNELLSNPVIENISFVSRLPGERIGMHSFIPEGVNENKDLSSVHHMWADENFIPTLHIELKEGRNFYTQSDNSTPTFILNETAVNTLHLKSPVGQYGTIEGAKGQIVAVVKDFNFASLHSVIEPLVIQYTGGQTDYLVARVNGSRIPEALRFLKEKITSLTPESLFMYSFLDDNIDRLYESEHRMERIFKVFVVFAILISCIGLLGLSTFTVRLKYKEIGIRKVLGASTSGIYMLLFGNIIRLILLALAIAVPATWWSMNKWLEDFAYRINIQWWIFAIAGITALIIAIITIGFQTYKAANVNPIKMLRIE